MAKDKKDKKDKSGSWFVRHKVLTVILAIIVVIILNKAFSGGSEPAASNTDGSTPAASDKDGKATTAKIGQPARDGKFEFTIKKVKCGVSSVSDSSGYVTKSAQGQYCLVTVSVKNIGDKQQILLESDQKLLNASGQEYSPDSVATLYNSDNADVFVSQINPGNSVEGILVYDIPKDQTPVTAELHDSSFSNGVKVNIK